ncbi:MAG: hypothetical protein WC462_01090 [archaeon]
MKTKGFAGAILMLAILLSVALLLNANNETRNAPSYKEILPEAKIVLNNYELALKQAVRDCDWELSKDEIRACIDSSATALLLKSNSLNMFKCSKTNATNHSMKKFYIDLNCSEIVEKNWKTSIKLDVNKRIYIG